MPGETMPLPRASSYFAPEGRPILDRPENWWSAGYCPRVRNAYAASVYRHSRLPDN